MNEYAELGNISDYSKRGINGAFNLAKARGQKGIIFKDGTVIARASDLQSKAVATPETETASDSGRDSDKRKIPYPFSLSGLTSLAPGLNHGNIGGNAGLFSMQKPFITIVQKPPIGTEDLNKYIGLPLEAKKTLNELSGYTEVSNLFIPDSISNLFLKEEESEIRQLLDGGVII